MILKISLLICLILFFINTHEILSGIVSCDSLYNSNKDVWLKGEGAPVPFPLQLAAVYSYAPSAFVFGSNLLLGDLYSTSQLKNSNSAASNGTGKGSKLNRTPFSSFFDYNHYIWYWSQHKLQTITSQYYYFCYEREGTPYSHAQIIVNRIPEFRPFHNNEISKLLKENKVKFPFPNHSLVSVEGKYKMIGFYNFWNHLTMLKYVHQSIKPALPIAKFSNAVLQILTNSFIAIHLRVDEEAFPSSLLPGEGGNENDIEKNSLLLDAALQGIEEEGNGRNTEGKKALNSNASPLTQILDYLKYSSCFTDLQHLNYELFIEPPSLYLMTNARTKQDKRKIKLIIDSLNSLGFVNVFTRKRVYDKYGKRVSAKVVRSSILNNFGTLGATTTTSMEVHDDISLYRTFSSEQLQYVDMIVSKASNCFIPSQLPTIASYLIKRLQKLDRDVMEDYSSVNETSYGSLATYRDWGL
jgi:hypothetical protein